MEVLSKDTDRLRQSLYELRQAWDRLLSGISGEYYGGTMSAILLRTEKRAGSGDEDHVSEVRDQPYPCHK